MLHTIFRIFIWVYLYIFSAVIISKADKFELCNTENLYQDPKTCLIVSSYLTTWENAQTFCRFFGGDLLAIKNKEDDEFIAGLIQKFEDSPKEFWIGLNNLPSREFEWSSAELLNYTHWKTELDSRDPQNDNGSCVFIDSENEWNIDKCSTERGFICLETPLTFNLPGCGSEMIRFRDSCYWTVNGLDGWYPASKWCRTEGGELVDVKDDVENAFLYQFLLRSNDVFWIGLHKTNHSLIPTWTRGEIPSYTNWDSFPNLDLESCAVIERNGKWMMQPCDSAFSGAVCKKPTPLPITEMPITTEISTATDRDPLKLCSTGWIKIDTHCYTIQKSALLSWLDALNFCLSVGGNLASFEKFEDEHNLFDSLSTDSNTDNIIFWIGLTCNFSSSAWNDGNPLHYAEWDAVQISSMTDVAEELCVAHSTKTDKWFCLPCESHAGFACVTPTTSQEGFGNAGECNGTVDSDLCFQLSNEDDRRSSTTLTAVDPCPAAWDKLGGKCYKVQHENLKDWSSARNDCQNFGDSDLVSIHSDPEQDFLLEILSMREVKVAWIGLHDRLTEGEFAWIDNSNLDYKNFAPQNGRGSASEPWEDCVMIIDNKWQTMECRRKLAYICQKRTFSVTQMTVTNESATVYITPEEVYTTDSLTSSESEESSETSNTKNSTLLITLTVQEADPNISDNTTVVELQEDTIYDMPRTKTIHSDEENTIIASDLPLDVLSPLFSTFLPGSTEDLNTCKCEFQEAGMSGGTIAGIVLATLVIVTLIIGIILYFYRKNLMLDLMKGKLSFDNALYNPNSDNIQLRESV